MSENDPTYESTETVHRFPVIKLILLDMIGWINVDVDAHENNMTLNTANDQQNREKCVCVCVRF